MVRLVINNGVQQGRVFRLKPGVNRLGRTLDNHFQIPDSSVSTHHCEVFLADSGVLVRDLNSTNGTFIDGEPVAQEAPLLPGQVLQLGAIDIRLEQALQTDDTEGISVPSVAVAHEPSAILLPDGSSACANHSEAAATFQCTRCNQTLCDACVRTVRRLGGENLVFCSICSGPCEPLAVSATASAGGEGKPRPGFLERVALRMTAPFRR